jgi:hypothetical protein
MLAMLAGAVAAAVAVGVLVVIQRAHVRRVGEERRALLDGAEALLDDAEVTQHGIGHPALTGTLDGRRVRAELVADTLMMRRLPRLWIVVSVFAPLEAAPVDIVLRPQELDTVSSGGRFPCEHPVPAGWPDPARIATPTPAAPDLAPFEAAGALLHDPRTKEILAGAGGVRVVHELARGEVGLWRVVRRAKFTVDGPLGRLADALAAATTLLAALDAPPVTADMEIST